MNIPSLNGNWVDLVILIFIGIYILETLGRGLILGFIVFFAELVLSILSTYLYQIIDDKISGSRINLILGIIPGFFSGLIVASFLIVLIVMLPIRPDIKQDV